MKQTKNLLLIKDLTLSVAGKDILNNLNLTIKPGEIHVIMGPNGSGKSSLALTLAGHPDYQPSQGQVKFLGQDLLDLSADQRAAKGLYLSFQSPPSIPGVSVSSVLMSSLNAHRKSRKEKLVTVSEFYNLVRPIFDDLKLDHQVLSRSFNEGFSGGERKKLEAVQFLLLQPSLTILDEIDSGLDIDALGLIVKKIEKSLENQQAVLIITHYNRILNFIKADFVHILKNGRIVQSGDQNLSIEVEQRGYDSF